MLQYVIPSFAQFKYGISSMWFYNS